MLIEFLETAERELDEAVAYYDSEQPGLGEAFLGDIILGIDRIKSFPEAWQQFTENTRRYILRRFPYGLLYTIIDNKIVILAIGHMHRAPEYWEGR